MEEISIWDEWDDSEQEPEFKKRELENMASNHGKEDLISNLPEPIIHHFMSFLPTKDSTRTSILSKKWKSIWDSYPILDFNQTSFEYTLYRIPMSARVQRELFLNYLHDSIQRRQERKIGIQKFSLQALLRGPWSDRRIDKSIDIAIENHVKELDLDITIKRGAFYKVPKSLYFAKSITFLKLEGLNFEFQYLLSGCPLIKDLRINRCGLKKIKYSGDHKLTNLELGSCERLEIIEIVSTNLQSFVFVCSSKPCLIDLSGCRFLKNVSLARVEIIENPRLLDLSGCRFLKNISLSQIEITENWLGNQICKLLFLENLRLDGCVLLKKVKVFHRHLKRFDLIASNNVTEVEIDTPNLVSFSYSGDVICFSLLNSSASLEATLSLSPSNGEIEWFVKFRTLLGLFGHCKKLKLVSHCEEDLIIPQELKDSFVPPLFDLKLLEIEVRSYLVKYRELLASLLWLSPHLERLLIYNPTLKVKSIKFQYETIVSRDEDPIWWEAHLLRCWQYHLTSVVLENFNDRLDVETKRRLLEYFAENAKRLESIRDNSKTFKVVKGKLFEKI